MRSFLLFIFLLLPTASSAIQPYSYIELQNKHVPWWKALGYEMAFRESAKEFHVSRSWLMALCKIENNFKSIGTDGKGSYGIMQLQIQTAQIVAKGLGDYNWDLIDGIWLEEHPEQSIRFAACHMRDLLNTFHGSYHWATRAYNGGSTRIKEAKKGNRKWKHLSVKYYENVFEQFNKIKEFK